MSHELEIIDGKASFAHVGAPAWHQLGTCLDIDADMNTWMDESGTGFEVKKVPLFYSVSGMNVNSGEYALIRGTDNKFLSSVSEDWNVIQNSECWNWMWKTFIETKKGTVETAGSLFDGKIIFILVKLNTSFEAIKDDRVDNYVLITNSHKYGSTLYMMYTKIRVVCNNTFQMALRGNSEVRIRLNHSRPFDENILNRALANSELTQEKYKKNCEVLLSKKISAVDELIAYYANVFPSQNKEEQKELTSKNISTLRANSPIRTLLDIYDKQPGYDLGKDTWYSAFNSVTYAVDHLFGRSPQTRLQSAWYGPNKDKKERAMKAALEMAA